MWSERRLRSVDTQGGRIQLGWAIWAWPRVFVEAEHHAVWAPDSGWPWIDPTPSEVRRTERLFRPDDSATYDFESEGVRRDIVRLCAERAHRCAPISD